MKNKYTTKIEKLAIKVINYFRNLFKTAQLINERQIKQRAYELIEQNYHEMIQGYVYQKIHELELIETRYSVDEDKVKDLLKKWLKK